MLLRLAIFSRGKIAFLYNINVFRLLLLVDIYIFCTFLLFLRYLPISNTLIVIRKLFSAYFLRMTPVTSILFAIQ
ncbi:hypothetical protein Runsl_3360 [Runella slithyformis DSM 19594]|uniref:Uncharacterized protein n=1 Tax=Runella slithyformis (strain ATCC 29530 / DSM 19594 / LMG 11500 / NCIMB 11436 / LSU 4) TaxID=761193 RepID=A0A7U3ZM59_RUNSL|nr:hypothetical protein Runsl_3360 [Runella slithyformis DSM 19594]